MKGMATVVPGVKVCDGCHQEYGEPFEVDLSFIPAPLRPKKAISNGFCGCPKSMEMMYVPAAA